MTPANSLTIFRLALALIMTMILSADLAFAMTLALATFILAALTDYWDGRLARQMNHITRFGQLMDPVADKILICAAFVCLTARQLIPAWMVVVIISREFLVTGLRLLAAGYGKILPAEWWGKVKTIAQITAVIAIMLIMALLEEIAPPLLGPDRMLAYRALLQLDLFLLPAIHVLGFCATLLTLFSGVMYLRQTQTWVMTDD